jgi:hypothetical protein
MKRVLISERFTESRIGDVLLLPIAALAFWTIAYQLVLVLRWPAKTIAWFFLVIAVGGSSFWASLEENPRHARARLSVSFVSHRSTSSGFGLRNYGSFRATAKPG